MLFDWFCRSFYLYKFLYLRNNSFVMVGFMLVSVVLIALVVALLTHVIWLVGWAIGKIVHFSLAYAPFGWAALILVLLSWSVMAYGFWIGRVQFSVRNIDYAHPSMPESFEGYKVVHISDLHLSTFNDKPEIVRSIVDSVNAQSPDLICFTGDLISLGVDEALPFADDLRRLKAKDGVVSVLGNHDFVIYSRKYKTPEERMAEVRRLVHFQESDLGWKLLRNEHIFLQRGDERIAVVGVDNHSCKKQGYQTVSLGDLPKAMDGTEGFRFLLSHDPTHWDAEVLPQTDIPLQLSGHTHSAQIRLFGWSPASWVFDETAGLYTKKDESGVRSLYINVGLGSTLPIRIGCDGEITVLTFHRGRGE